MKKKHTHTHRRHSFLNHWHRYAVTRGSQHTRESFIKKEYSNAVHASLTLPASGSIGISWRGVNAFSGTRVPAANLTAEKPVRRGLPRWDP